MSVCVEERKRRKEDNNKQMGLNDKKKSVNLINDYMGVPCILSAILK